MPPGIATTIGTIITGITAIIIVIITIDRILAGKERPRGSCCCGAFVVDGRLWFRVVDDLGEGLGVEAGSAYQSAVDVADTAEGFGVVGLH